MTNTSNTIATTPPEFAEAELVLSEALAEAAVSNALSRWMVPSHAEAERIAAILADEFPDDYDPQAYWTQAAPHDFRGFFSWGHDQDFGWGVTRKGAMGPRHKEVIAECLSYGLLPASLADLDVLDVGCWSGGDILALAGFGANVIALEEHAKSAASASRVCSLLKCPASVVVGSVYNDRQDWRERFDVIYASGVVYHVTDPLLFVRILFAYLKPGGILVLETKASGSPDSSCTYSGTLQLGWNWYAPTRAALGRWLVDGGFAAADVRLRVRKNGRLLSRAVKTGRRRLPETAGFSRPGSWLEGEV